MWFLGDNFLAKTYHDHFHKRSSAGFYTKENFEISIFCNSKYDSNNPNLLAWVQNAIVSALMKHARLPDVIVVMLDGDILQLASNHQQVAHGVSGWHNRFRVC